MASLQENLELLKNIATNPKKQLDHYIAASACMDYNGSLSGKKDSVPR